MNLREAAQQALEALMMMRDKYEEYACSACDHADAAVYALRTALAEPVQEPVAWLRVIDEAMVTHHLGVADLADDYETAKRKMNNLLCMAQDIGAYFALPSPQRPAEPMQEPVAWIPKWVHDRLTGQLGAIADPVKWGVDAPLYVRFTSDTVPLYTAPPQRKPLTEEEIRRIYETHRASVPLYHAIARAIERAHGIGGQDESA